MSRIHDMGGRFGDGPVVPEPDGIPQLADWQARALALTLAAGALGQWNIDVSRHAREKLAPKDYARFTYYEKWISALADLLVARGVMTAAELTDPTPGDHPLAARALKAADVVEAMAKGSPYIRDEGPNAQFSVGDLVRTRRPAVNLALPGGHTRLPSYAAGARGRVIRRHGNHVLPDSSAHDMGETPEPLYAVAFPAAELWSAPEHPGDEVIIDLWQSYLEPL